MTLSVFVCMNNNNLAFRGHDVDLNKGEDTDYKFLCTSNLGCVKKTDLIEGCVFVGLITDPDFSLRECSCGLI